MRWKDIFQPLWGHSSVILYLFWVFMSFCECFCECFYSVFVLFVSLFTMCFYVFLCSVFFCQFQIVVWSHATIQHELAPTQSLLWLGLQLNFKSGSGSRHRVWISQREHNMIVHWSIYRRQVGIFHPLPRPNPGTLLWGTLWEGAMWWR